MTPDHNIEAARLQKEIIDYLGISSGNIFFNFKDADNGVQLDVVTINPKHQQSFLFHSETGKDRTDALEKMRQYVISHRKTKNSYTIQWMKRGESELQTSYFRAKDIYEALDKLNFGDEKAHYKIFSITLNPSS